MRPAPDALVMGIDCGTQSAKVDIFDRVGTVVAHAQVPLQPMIAPQHGMALHPDDDIWSSIASATRAALDVLGPRASTRIGAVGICPIRCCKAFLDRNGDLVEPVMSWMDERAYEPYLPSDDRLAYATTLSGYVANRFTGAFTDTAANCIDLQWPIDTDTWDWSRDPDVLRRHGLRRDQLFDLRRPGDVAGTVSARAAASTGLAEGTPVVHTANDKAVEILGAGSLGERTVLVSLGTYIAAMLQGTRNIAGSQHLWTNFSSVPGRYLYESNGIRRGMWTVTWFLDLLGPEFAAAAHHRGLTRERYIEPEAAAVGPGSDGLAIVLDWLAPTDHLYRRGSMLGFDVRHQRGHIYRAIFEAIALTMHANVEAMCSDVGVQPDEIVISGGGAASDMVMQIFADVFGLPTSRSTHGGAALGAAMCAAAAIGLHPGIEAAAAAMCPLRERFDPDTVATDVYRRIEASNYRSIRSVTDPLYQHSAGL